MVEPIFDRANHRITQGVPADYTLKSSGSGKDVVAKFCRDCGTKLHLEFARFPDSIGVYAGTFDDPNWFQQTPDNTKYIFLDSASTGTMVRGGFNTFRQHARLNDGTPLEPKVYSENTVIRDDQRR